MAFRSIRKIFPPWRNSKSRSTPASKHTEGNMRGQWIGKYEGSRSGLVIINFDEAVSGGYSGYAHLIDDSGKMPPAFVVLKSKNSEMPFEMDAEILQVHGATHNTITEEELKKTYPDFIFPKKATAKFNLIGRKLNIEWETDIGTKGSAALDGGTAEDASELISERLTWAQFKERISAYPARKFIYRGQEKPWRLRTSFHRTGRADVLRFQFEDIPELYRALSSRTKHIYNLHDADQNGAFYNLAQHHGYPTPLLDWSYSPFVAAFCAYRKIVPEKAKPDDKVRIFVFDHVNWHIDWERIQTLRTYKRHFSILEFIAIDNDRMVPQQALSCLTNIEDIESYVREYERKKGVTYLQAFDLPATERNQVMAELSMMGITAGSMFPGLDGACEEVRERRFIRT